jgi:dipeptidyl aminopeptidase/acylaminoacyl peptidase
MRATADGVPTDITPEGFNVRTTVHEYGGGSYCLHDGTVFFTNFADQRLYRQEEGASPVPITPEVGARRHRYADGRVSPDGSLWVGVRERHEGEGSDGVINELVAVPVDGSRDPWIVAGGRDFYAAPRVSPDGTKLSFLSWDLPWMPWDGCELWVARLADGKLDGTTHVAGRDGEESIWQPEWSTAGDLVFASDRSGWWNLERICEGDRENLHPATAEFGYPAWAFGMRSYDFLGDGRIACSYDSDGRTAFAVLDPETREFTGLDLPHDSTRAAGLVAEGDTIVFVAGSATIPNEVVRANVTTATYDTVRASSHVDIDTAEFSIPEAIEFATENGLTAHALYYPPRNLSYAAEDDEAPPLIVMSHGGPTAKSTALFSLEKQFWTTRGFAVVDVNYGGSSGYGRAYRERLNGMWGVVDLEDCVHAAHYLVEQGAADTNRLLITGGSAGGYTTICALTFTDEFAGGTSYFGLADLVPFASGDTHKFESRYEHTLIGPYPEEAERYRDRSPINFVERISTPMLVLQGADDEVVPKSQAELIVAALAARGIPYAYLLFEGEGHGFRKAENIVRSLEAELSFYLQVLGLEPTDPLPPLVVENLSS